MHTEENLKATNLTRSLEATVGMTQTFKVQHPEVKELVFE
jgi:hypothetical protein